MSADAQRLIYDVVSLAELEAPEYELLAEAVNDSLKRFECRRSAHLENFAREKVSRFERHGHSRTYVLITPADDGGIDVPAFFTVGMTVLDLSKVSKTKRDRLSGDVSLTATGAYTIAELARCDRYTSEQLPGSVILDEAKQVIIAAREHVGGRFAVVDCRPEVLKQLYESAGFKHFAVAQSPSEMQEVEFVTACCVIKDW